MLKKMLRRRTVDNLTCWLSWVSVDFLSAVKLNEVPGCKSSDWPGTDDAWFYRGRDYTHTRRVEINDWCCTIKTKQKLTFSCSLADYRLDAHTSLHNIHTHYLHVFSQSNTQWTKPSLTASLYPSELLESDNHTIHNKGFLISFRSWF